jgi:hypothetical protein
MRCDGRNISHRPCRHLATSATSRLFRRPYRVHAILTSPTIVCASRTSHHLPWPRHRLLDIAPFPIAHALLELARYRSCIPNLAIIRPVGTVIPASPISLACTSHPDITCRRSP